jgi:hypothetical protein
MSQGERLMKMTRQGQGSRQLGEALRCIDRWRRERASKKEAIPDDVWNAAAEAARVDGVWVTSRALRLEFNRLKARVAGATSGRAVTKAIAASAESTAHAAGSVCCRAVVGKGLAPRKPKFVEVVLDAAREAGAVGTAGTAVIELMGRHGERMRIEVAGTSTVDVLGLSHTFWSRQP